MGLEDRNGGSSQLFQVVYRDGLYSLVTMLPYERALTLPSGLIYYLYLFGTPLAAMPAIHRELIAWLLCSLCPYKCHRGRHSRSTSPLYSPSSHVINSLF